MATRPERGAPTATSRGVGASKGSWAQRLRRAQHNVEIPTPPAPSNQKAATVTFHPGSCSVRRHSGAVGGRGGPRLLALQEQPRLGRGWRCRWSRRCWRGRLTVGALLRIQGGSNRAVAAVLWAPLLGEGRPRPGLRERGPEAAGAVPACCSTCSALILREWVTKRVWGVTLTQRSFLSSESEVFEILLPVTVFVLSDEEFLQAEERAALVPELREEKQEAAGSCCLSEGGLRPSGDSEGLNIWEEHSGTANQNGSMEDSEEECIPESVCNNSKLSISSGISKDAQSHSAALLTSPRQTELAKMSEVSGRKECNDNDAIPKVPLLSAADSEGRDETMDTSGQLVFPAACRDEELTCVLGVLSDESQEKQPEVHKEMGKALEVKGNLLIRVGQALK